MKLNIWIYSVCYKEVLNLLNVTEDHTSPEELDKIKVCYYFFRRETENIFSVSLSSRQAGRNFSLI